MIKEDLFVALIIIYLSVCAGCYLKLCCYKVKANKLLISVLGPVFLSVFATYIAWSYIQEKEKESGIKVAFHRKMLFMGKLMKINIQWFPSLIGFLAISVLKAERSKIINQAAKKRQTRRTFRDKSYEFYDGCVSYGIA